MNTNKGFIGTSLLIIIGIAFVYGGWLLLSKNSLHFGDVVSTSNNTTTTTDNTSLSTTTGTVSTTTVSTTASTTPNVLKSYTFVGTAGKYTFKYPSPKFILVDNDPTLKGTVTLGTGDNVTKIIIHSVPIKSGICKAALINDAIFDASGNHPNSFTEFTERTIGSNDFYYIKTGQFEGVLSLNYYFVGASAKEAILFEVVSQGVDWQNPNLDIENDKGNLALKQILSTLTISK